MAKKRSKVSGKAKRHAAVATKKVEAPAASDAAAAAAVAGARASKAEAKAPAEVKAPAGLRKQIRRLEGQLADAARQERKRLRKLERARHRRQVAEAALADVLAEAPLPTAPAPKPAPPAKPAAAPKPATAAKKAVASTPARPRAARTTTPTRRAAPKSAPKSPPAAPAVPPEPDKP